MDLQQPYVTAWFGRGRFGPARIWPAVLLLAALLPAPVGAGPEGKESKVVKKAEVEGAVGR